MISLAACAAPHATGTAAPRAPAVQPTAPVPPRAPSLVELVSGDYENPRPPVLEAIAVAQPAKWGRFAPNMRTVGVMVFHDGRGPYNVTMGGDVGKLVGAAAILRVHGTWSPQMYDQMFATEPQIEVLPVSVPPLLDAAQARWTAWLAAHDAEIAATLDTAGARSAGRPFGVETVATKDLFMPSWNPAKRAVTVTFVRVVTRQSSVTTPGHGCGKYEHGMGGGAPGPCAPSPDMYPRTHTRAYSAEAAVAVTLGADGKLLEEHVYQLHPVPAAGPF